MNHIHTGTVRQPSKHSKNIFYKEFYHQNYFLNSNFFQNLCSNIHSYIKYYLQSINQLSIINLCPKISTILISFMHSIKNSNFFYLTN